ncbi:MAG TPA: hypothetical protein VN444_01365 [Verrucomicrobiae bacterium]|nr:hypothetical protein [Verrucomicrobiae bacterium]
MASRTIITLLSLFLAAGCAEIKAVFTPTPSPRLPARQSPPHVPARPARQEPPPPRLSPQVSSDRETQLTEEVNAMSHGVERTLLSIDRQKLKADQWETYQTIQSFLTQAREALTIKDFQQAMNLVQKAHVLSGELSKAVR